eukprot:7279464-Pyramimonas_sp.AAC.1
MWPGSGALGRRRTRSGLQLAPGIQNVAWEFNMWPGNGFLGVPGAVGSVRFCPDPAQTPLGRQDALF